MSELILRRSEAGPCAKCGGVRSIFGCGHVSKRDLADRMHAFIAGIEAKAA